MFNNAMGLILADNKKDISGRAVQSSRAFRYAFRRKIQNHRLHVIQHGQLWRKERWTSYLQ